VVGRSGRRISIAALAGCVVAAGCGGAHKTTASDGNGPGGTRSVASVGAGSGTSAGTGAGIRPGAAVITVVQRERIDARAQDWTLRTPALDGVTRVRILLPAGYRARPQRRYPVLYLLHGADSDYRSWTRYGAAEAITARAPMIVVMPDGGTMGWYTDWYENERPVRPAWETYHVGELVPWVDAHFRTIAGRRGRAIAGLSMGGYGALSYAARHPGTFVAAASFSGALEIGSEAAWGPRSGNAARWRAHLPISLAGRLRSLELLELRTGNGEPGPLDKSATRSGCGACGVERFLYPANVRLHERLRRLGIAHVWDDYGPGTHDWPYWRRDLRETLPRMVRVLAPPRRD
jgi:diacylglycerol O-acyltransferase / trehalose O-mycolyltransferase